MNSFKNQPEKPKLLRYRLIYLSVVLNLDNHIKNLPLCQVTSIDDKIQWRHLFVAIVFGDSFLVHRVYHHLMVHYDV